MFDLLKSKLSGFLNKVVRKEEAKAAPPETLSPQPKAADEMPKQEMRQKMEPVRPAEVAQPAEIFKPQPKPVEISVSKPVEISKPVETAKPPALKPVEIPKPQPVEIQKAEPFDSKPIDLVEMEKTDAPKTEKESVLASIWPFGKKKETEMAKPKSETPRPAIAPKTDEAPKPQPKIFEAPPPAAMAKPAPVAAPAPVFSPAPTSLQTPAPVAPPPISPPTHAPVAPSPMPPKIPAFEAPKTIGDTMRGIKHPITHPLEPLKLKTEKKEAHAAPKSEHAASHQAEKAEHVASHPAAHPAHAAPAHPTHHAPGAVAQPAKAAHPTIPIHHAPSAGAQPAKGAPKSEHAALHAPGAVAHPLKAAHPSAPIRHEPVGGPSMGVEPNWARLEKKALSDDEREMKVKVGLGKSITGFLSPTLTLADDDVRDLLEELELELLESDVAYEVSLEVAARLRKQLVGAKISKNKMHEHVGQLVQNVLVDVMTTKGSFDFFARVEAAQKPAKILFVGPNGAGKTTTMAKVAHAFMKKGKKVVFAASDTFRAAAIEQTEAHAARLGVPVVKSGYGSDPAAVAFDAIKYAKAHDLDVVLIDSAGRQDTNANLLDELRKINRVVQPDLKIYIGESIGGNALIEQIKAFHATIGVDGAILTKIDCDAKGGTAISLTYATGVPILFLGTGQKYDDLEAFDARALAKQILGNDAS